MNGFILLIALFIVFSVTSVDAFVPIRGVGKLGIVPTTSILRQTRLKSGLHDAAEAGDLEFLSGILEKDPEAISKYDIDGQLMLHFAAKNGYVELAKYLNEKGPGFINFKNIRYRTPLFWACQNAGKTEGCEEIAIYLVENGASLDIESKDFESPYDKAKKSKLGKPFADKLREISKTVEVRLPVDIAVDRVYWG